MGKPVTQYFNIISKVKLGDPIIKVRAHLKNNHLNLANTVKKEAR